MRYFVTLLVFCVGCSVEPTQFNFGDDAGASEEEPEKGTESEGLDSETELDTGGSSDTEVDTEATDTEVGTETDTDTDMDTDTETDTGTPQDTDTGTDTGTPQDTETDTSTDTETDTGVYDTPCSDPDVAYDSSYSRCWWKEEILGSFDQANTFCTSLGPSWRVATISDLRALVGGCNAITLGNTACGVTDATPNWTYFSSACTGCKHEEGEPCFRVVGVEGDCFNYLHGSATILPDGETYFDQPSRWYVTFYTDGLVVRGVNLSDVDTVMWHCVRNS